MAACAWAEDHGLPRQLVDLIGEVYLLGWRIADIKANSLTDGKAGELADLVPETITDILELGGSFRDDQPSSSQACRRIGGRVKKTTQILFICDAHTVKRIESSLEPVDLLMAVAAGKWRLPSGFPRPINTTRFGLPI